MQVLCKLFFYITRVYDRLYSTVNPMKYLDSDVIYCVYLLDAHTYIHTYIHNIYIHTYIHIFIHTYIHAYIHTYTIGLECILHYYTIYPHSINSSNFPTKGESQFSYLVLWVEGGEGQFPYHISTSIVGGGGGGEGQFPYLISTSIVYTDRVRGTSTDDTARTIPLFTLYSNINFPCHRLCMHARCELVNLCSHYST